MTTSSQRFNLCALPLRGRNLAPHLLGVFLLGFLLIFSCYAGLPADFNADHPQNIESCESLTYGQFIKLIVNPLTPAWFYPPLTKDMGYLRPLQYFILKGCYDLFGYGMFPIHLAEAIGFGLLSLVLFLLVYGATQSLLFAWLSAILYASFPSNFVLNLSVYPTDFQYYVSILSIASLAFLGWLTFSSSKSKGLTGIAFAGWIVTIWLAIKLKSSEKILPLVGMGFLLLRNRFILSRIGRSRYVVLIVATLAMGFLVIPIRTFDEWRKVDRALTPKYTIAPSTHKDQTTLSFSLKNMFHRTFNLGGGKFPLLSISRKEFPDSFTENYGFFLGWLFWLGFLLLPIILSRYQGIIHRLEPSMREKKEAVQHGLILVLVWFGFILLGFGSGATIYDKRLLNFGYVPSVPLFFGVASMLEQGWLGEIEGRRILFRAVLAALVIYTCVINFASFFKLVGHFAGMQDVLVRVERDLFREIYREEPNNLNLYQRHLELETRAVVVDWYDLPGDWFEKAQEKLRKEKKIFFYSRAADSKRLQRFREAGYPVTLWEQYHFLDARPLFFRFSKQVALKFPFLERKLAFKKGKGTEIFVYLIEERIR